MFCSGDFLQQSIPKLLRNHQAVDAAVQDANADVPARGAGDSIEPGVERSGTPG